MDYDVAVRILKRLDNIDSRLASIDSEVDDTEVEELPQAPVLNDRPRYLKIVPPTDGE